MVLYRLRRVPWGNIGAIWSAQSPVGQYRGYMVLYGLHRALRGSIGAVWTLGRAVGALREL